MLKCAHRVRFRLGACLDVVIIALTIWCCGIQLVGHLNHRLLILVHLLQFSSQHNHSINNCENREYGVIVGTSRGTNLTHRNCATVEWPTFWLWLATLGAWFLLVEWAPAIPWWLLPILGGLVVCQFGSLQHECLHGHPTRHQSLNNALAFAPLALWIPYRIYRQTHLAHHRTSALTHPHADPESFYLDGARWAELNTAQRLLAHIDTTLAGRLIVGPWLVFARLWSSEIRRLANGDFERVWTWVGHLCAIGIVLGYVEWRGLSALTYLLAFAWPGTSLTLLRSYAEHRPSPDPAKCSVIVESGPYLSLLFLNNNLHCVHHAQPAVPWYQIRELYHARRRQWRRGNGDYYFAGYRSLVRRFVFTPRSPVHPTA